MTASGDQSADLALAMGKEADRTVALGPITTHDGPVSFRVQPRLKRVVGPVAAVRPVAAHAAPFYIWAQVWVMHGVWASLDRLSWMNIWARLPDVRMSQHTHLYLYANEHIMKYQSQAPTILSMSCCTHLACMRHCNLVFRACTEHLLSSQPAQLNGRPSTQYLQAIIDISICTASSLQQLDAMQTQLLHLTS